MSSQKNKNNYLDEFIKDLSQWALNIMSGDLTSRIKTSDSKDLKTLSSNLNIVSEMLENQLSKTNEQLDQFSKYKEEKNKLSNTLGSIVERVLISYLLNY